MEILLVIAYSSLFVFLIGKYNFFKIEGIPVQWIKVGLILKILAGTGVGFVYTYYYTDRLTADTFKFFDDSRILFNLIFTDPSTFFRLFTGIGSQTPEAIIVSNQMTNWYDTFSPFNDNRTMIRLNTMLRFLSSGYYYVHVVFICFLSLAGMVAITKVISREFPHLTKPIFLVFLLMPSVLFWGSGLLKDALVFFSLGFTLYTFDKIIVDKKTNFEWVALFTFSLFLLMITKFHSFLLILPALPAWYLAASGKLKGPKAFIVMGLIFLCLIYVIQLLIPEWDIPELLARKQASFIELGKNSGAASYIDIPVIKPDFFHILLMAPLGFITSLTRPFITDSGSAMMTLSAVENTCILLLIIWTLFKAKWQLISNKALPWLCLYFVVSSYMIIGLVTPILGAIVRYKAQALPFLIIFLLLLTFDRSKSSSGQMKNRQ
ncbi:MAG: hypothetical protein IPN13_13305 [Bacteroidetes bacterium]|nr:hypothetical protein [Bacteroidota bacterium]